MHGDKEQNPRARQLSALPLRWYGDAEPITIEVFHPGGLRCKIHPREWTSGRVQGWWIVRPKYGRNRPGKPVRRYQGMFYRPTFPAAFALAMRSIKRHAPQTIGPGQA